MVENNFASPSTKITEFEVKNRHKSWEEAKAEQGRLLSLQMPGNTGKIF